MKILTRNHSPSTKVSDLLMVLFATAYFLYGLCVTDDFFACFLFLLCVIIIISVKYLQISENE